MITFELKKKPDESTGQVMDTLVKIQDGKEEDWGTVQDFDRLFNAASGRWGTNWDLEKVMMAIRESEID